ncbi:hypothetical protein Tco_0119448, partial [Tanacetum coccineum]
APTLTSKLFSNMRRASNGYSGVVTSLFESMLVQAHDEEQQQSPLRITSSPSLSLQPTQPSPSPEPIQPTHEAEETTSMPHDSPLHVVHSHESAELKSGKARRKAKIVLSDDEEIAEEEEVHEKPSDETEVLVQEETPTEIIEEHGSGKKGEMEISTANIQLSTGSPLKVSTDVPHVYTRRSVKDKGKAIMEEPARKLEEEERSRFNAE